MKRNPKIKDRDIKDRYKKLWSTSISVDLQLQRFGGREESKESDRERLSFQKENMKDFF